ncbi:hypothetical protein EDEG_03937 [Edhazardia aedis USNM 41457]|uniref:RNA polymerase II transcription factor B subunit 2 n=1 Tax=Edhazardia aedis (strain USNM 41457) TaxID=1003232 RepID=J9D1M0_EDHAE|nr:hypothetical protein EDEG_03937 [Edhazardia aedis USNM 41457]|eukprot:EJW01474.1 hypothetical protein EDEG_03937 [Edhazardia aedis USNM 41457]
MHLNGNIINFISKLPKTDRDFLYGNEIFSCSLIKTMDKITKCLVVQLCSLRINLNNLKKKDFYAKKSQEIIKALKCLNDLGLIVKKSDYIELDFTFRDSLVSGFKDICRNSRIVDNFDDSTNLGLGIFNIQNNDKYLGTENYNMSPVKSIENIKKTVTIFNDYESKNTSNKSFQKYEEILHLIVDQQETPKNEEILKLLTFSRILNKNLEITNTGFDFLLKTRKEQLWILLITTIKYLKSTMKIEEKDFILLIFELCEKRPYKSYKIINCPSSIQTCINYMSKLGLLENSIKNNTVILSISPLFINLFEENLVLSESFMYIETNFKLYAYTTSKYDFSILSLFSKISCKLPNLISAIINEDSVNTAFDKKISAKQISYYLKSKGKNVPKNVVEQVYIWESKRNRIKTSECTLFKGFLNLMDFKKAVDVCKEKHWLVDVYEDKRFIFVNNLYAEEFKEYIKNSSLR